MAMLGMAAIWFVMSEMVGGRKARSIVVDPATPRDVNPPAAGPRVRFRAPPRQERDFPVRVLDPHGKPLARAQVWRFPNEDAFFLSAGPPPAPKSTTDASGMATIKSYFEE